MEPKLIMLVGLPGCGKTTYTNEMISKYPKAIVLSTDDLVEEEAKRLGKTYNDIWKDYVSQATKIFDRRCSEVSRIREGLVIVDRTNLTVQSRRKILNKFHAWKKEAVVFETPQDHKDRLAGREKQIPDFVLASMARNFEKPTTHEGFDVVQTVTT